MDEDTRGPESSKPPTADDEGTSQQVDEILKDKTTLSSDKHHSVDLLTSAKNISYERLPMLEVVFDRLLRLLTTTLRNFTSENVELKLKYIRSIRYGTYIEEADIPGIFTVFQLKQWGTSGLLYISNKLVFSVIEILLGGRKTETRSFSERPYTSLERSLVERFAKVIFHDMTLAFEPIENVRYEFDRLETNPTFLSIVEPTSASIKVRIEVSMDKRGGYFDFLIPYASIEPAREKLLQMFTGEKFGQDNIWETHLMRELWETNIEANVILSERRVKLSEVMNWKVGDFFPLEAKSDSDVTLKCKDKPIVMGSIGNRNRYVAVKVKRNLLTEPNQD